MSFDDFEIVKEVQLTHACPVPKPTEVNSRRLSGGTIIKCKTCGVEYQLYWDQRDNWFWSKL